MARAIILAGLSFGDEGKGSVTDALTRKFNSPLTVRYNGGAQAAHNVVTSDGKHHTFSQFGAGTLAGAQTYLSEYMLVNPLTLFSEAKHLEKIGVSDPLSRLHVDRDALVTTPYHMCANIIIERSRSTKHGSTGMGIGTTMEDWLENDTDVLLVDDLIGDPEEKLVACRKRWIRKIIEMTLDVSSREWDSMTSDVDLQRTLLHYKTFRQKVDIVDSDWFANAMALYHNPVIFEGAQGTLLDKDFGFHPHTTWSDTTFGNADLLLDAAGVEDWKRDKFGILRAYTTRHGVGPMPSESKDFDVASAHDHNRPGELQGTLRSGALDMELVDYALDVVGPINGLIVTNLDRVQSMGHSVPVVDHYDKIDPIWYTKIHPHSQAHQERLTVALNRATYVPEQWDTHDPRVYASWLAARAGQSLFAISTGPTSDDKEIVGEYR